MTLQIFWPKPGNPREGWQKGGTNGREGGGEGGSRAKPGNQLVYYIMYYMRSVLDEATSFRDSLSITLSPIVMFRIYLIIVQIITVSIFVGKIDSS